MSWQYSALFASLCSNLILLGVFVLLYRQQRERHMASWAWGWGFHAGRYLFDGLGLSGVAWVEQTHLIQVCALASGLLLLKGTGEFFAQQLSKRWLALAALVLAWLVAGHFLELSFVVENLPVFLFQAAVLMRMGGLLLRAGAEQGISARATGWLLILWGVDVADYPFLRDSVAIAPWEFFSGTLFSLGVALGMLLGYFQRARGELQRSREYYRTLVETIPHGVVECGSDGTVRYANRAYARLLGVEVAELAGRPLWDFMANETARQKLRAKFAARTSGGGAPTSEVVRNHGATGGTAWWQVDWNYMRDSAQQIDGVLAVVTDISARMAAEHQLHEGNITLRAMLRDAPLAIFSLDGADRVRLWNHSAAELFGWSEEEAQGARFAEMVLAGEQRRRFATAVAKARQGVSVRLECEGEHRAGLFQQLALAMGPIHGPGGTSDEIFVIADDATERARMELALRHSEETYRNLVEATPVAVFVHVEGYLVYLNPAAVRLFGAERPGQLEGRALAELLVVEERERMAVALARPRPEGEERTSLPLRIQPLVGSVREIEATFLEIDYSGCQTHMALCIDVTERNRAEVALRQSEAAFRALSREFETIFNGIPDSLTLWSPDLRLVWANPATQMFYGRSVADLLGRRCGELCPLHQPPFSDCEVLRCFQSKRTEEGVVKASDGRAWGVKAFPLLDGDGAVVRVIRLASDITERLQLREEAARSAHLAALGELAAGVAHEVNNPTGLILLDLPLLRDMWRDVRPLLDERLHSHGDFPCAGLDYSLLREQVPHLLDEVLEGAQRIKAIVEELKDFSRPVDPHQFVSVDLNEVVRKAIGLVGSQLRKATDRLGVDYAPAPCWTNGSFQRLEQVVINLLLNAAQALTDRHQEVRITVEEDGEWCQVRVRDGGRGIRPEHLAQITDPFFTTRREVGGTGLGLSVSSRIIAEHGGSLQFDSVPGSGTCVTMSLPVGTREGNS